MTGARARPHQWGPWAGGVIETFEQSDVRAFGKLSRWGDARVHYLVRLADGTELFVNVRKQAAPDEEWLKRLGASVITPRATRDCGWAIAWREVSA